MNTIEQAAKRIEQLRRSGIEVPWARPVSNPARRKPRQPVSQQTSCLQPLPPNPS